MNIAPPRGSWTLCIIDTLLWRWTRLGSQPTGREAGNSMRDGKQVDLQRSSYGHKREDEFVLVESKSWSDRHQSNLKWCETRLLTYIDLINPR